MASPCRVLVFLQLLLLASPSLSDRPLLERSWSFLTRSTSGAEAGSTGDFSAAGVADGTSGAASVAVPAGKEAPDLVQFTAPHFARSLSGLIPKAARSLPGGPLVIALAEQSTVAELLSPLNCTLARVSHCAGIHIQTNAAGFVTSLTFDYVGTYGALPTSISTLHALTGFNIPGGTQFTRPILNTLGTCLGLTRVSLQTFWLSLQYETLTPKFLALPNLQYLSIAYGAILGGIPLFSGLKRLTYLQITHSNLKGTIPDSIGGLERLQVLDFSDNLLTGTIPSAMQGLTALDELNLAYNQLSGTLPGWLGGLTGLTSLDLHDNQLQGAIPGSLGGLAKLEALNLVNNQLTGTLPEPLGGLTKLTELHLGVNQLSGSLPAWLGGLNALKILSLQENQLVGTIPDSLGALKKITSLDLSHNGLTGDFPPFLSLTATQLNLNINESAIIDLSYNYLASQPGFDPLYSYLTLTHNCLRRQVVQGTDNAVNLFPQRPLVQCQAFCGLRTESLTPPCAGLGVCSGYPGAFHCTNCTNGTLPSFWVPAPDTNLTCAFLPPPPPPSPPISSPLSAASPPSLSGGQIVGIVVGCAAFVGLIVALAAFVAYHHGQRMKDTWTELDYMELDNIQLQGGVAKYTLRQLQEATEDFSERRVLGEGGYGKVYKGVLPPGAPQAGKVVAVKQAKAAQSSGAEFRNEIELLSRVHHRNLVGLVGFCREAGEELLVYEFIALGTVSEWLHPKDPVTDLVLSFDQRLVVALGSARGLEYLHFGIRPPIIHRDIKPGNILLDEHLHAKVADFGISKAVGEEQPVQGVMTMIKGTPGYMDPEYYLANLLTEKSDVYSFGIVLLELGTGWRVFENGRHIRCRVCQEVHEHGILSIADPRIERPDPLTFEKFIRLAMRCSTTRATARPSMQEVREVLQEMQPRAGHLERDGSGVHSSFSHSLTAMSVDLGPDADFSAGEFSEDGGAYIGPDQELHDISGAMFQSRVEAK